MKKLYKAFIILGAIGLFCAFESANQYTPEQGLIIGIVSMLFIVIGLRRLEVNKKMDKEITKISISFKSKYQIPLIMVSKLYYETKEDKKNKASCFGEVLLSSDCIKTDIIWCYFKSINKYLKFKNPKCPMYCHEDGGYCEDCLFSYEDGCKISDWHFENTMRHD